MTAGILIFSIITVAFAGALMVEKPGFCPVFGTLDAILEPECDTDIACNGSDKCCGQRCTTPDDSMVWPVTEETEDDIDVATLDDDELDDDDDLDDDDIDDDDEDDNDGMPMTKEEHIAKIKARKGFYLKRKAKKAARKEQKMKNIEENRAAKIAKWQDKGKHSKAEHFQKKWVKKDAMFLNKIAAKRANKLVKKEHRKEARLEHQQMKKAMTPEELEEFKAEKKAIRLEKKENRMEKKQMKKDMTPAELEEFKAEKKAIWLEKKEIRMEKKQMKKNDMTPADLEGYREERKENRMEKQYRKKGMRKENQKLARQERKQQRKMMGQTV